MKIPNINRCVILILSLSILECVLVGYIGWWRSPFWEAVNNKDLNTFITYIGYFTIAALTICLVSSYNQYLQQYTALVYRYKLSRKAFKIPADTVEGQAQRVQEDCFKYPLYLITLGIGLFKNLLLLFVFIGLLVYQLSWYYLLFPIMYALIGTLIAGKLAAPLINLNYVNQVYETKFRAFLTKLNYAGVHRNNYNLFKTTKQLSYFQYFYNQITVIVPYLMLSPMYFGGYIIFGIFMQVASCMAQIIDCMSYLINAFPEINKWLSCRKRLKELQVI